MDVPGAELLQGGRLFIGEVEHDAVTRRLRRLEHGLEDVGEVLSAADGVELRPGDREIH